MAFKKQVVTAVTNPYNFLYQFCKEIENVSDKFILTDMTEYSGYSDRYTNASFTILDNFVLKFEVGYINSTISFKINCKYDDTSVFNYSMENPNINFGVYISTANSLNLVVDNKITYRLASNNNAVSLKFGNYFSRDYVSTDLIFIITDSGIPICGISSTNTVNEKEQWTSSELSPTPVCKTQLYDAPYHTLKYNLYDRISYDYSGHDIEIIENKVIVNGNVKADTTNGLFDSSCVTPNALYMLDGLKYYAVDDHTIMRV